jgi:hypothetical protein
MGLYTIKSKRPVGRWRAGKFFAKEPDVFELDDEQIAAVRADALLIIIDDPAPESAPEPEKTEPEFIPQNARRAKR